jgi:ribosomal protein S18 acetylase RimI-like enzyme
VNGHVVRHGVEADVPVLTALINTAFEVERFFKRGDRTSEDAVRALLARGNILVVDDEDRRAIASVYVEVRGDRIYIGMVAVEPAHQRQGLGRRLMDAAEAHGRACGCRAADITVVNLRTELPPFYQRLGYVQTGTAAFPDVDDVTRDCHLILMSKPLE